MSVFSEYAQDHQPQEMAQLTDTERRKIVQRLAVWETPVEVGEWASEEFGKDVTVEQVHHYDPTKNDEVADKWQDLFQQTRREFLNDMETLRLSHRAVRVRELTGLYDEAKEEDREEAARLLKQIAREVGGKFTNEQVLEHSGPEGGPINVIFDSDTPEPDGS